MVTRLEALYTWVMLPVYAWQGLGVRRKTHRLPPPRQRVVTNIEGKGEPLNILIIGDSSAAGVGVTDFDDSLGGQLPKILHEKSSRPIFQRVSGNNSATCMHIRDHVLPHLPAEKFDYIALNVGVNDAKNFHRGTRFCKDFGTLVYALLAKYPGATIIWYGVIDMEKIPALPSPLNKILGIRSRIIDRNGKILCKERGALAPQSEWQPVAENFAVDGFHASAKGYREWAEKLADYIIEREAETTN